MAKEDKVNEQNKKESKFAKILNMFKQSMEESASG